MAPAFVIGSPPDRNVTTFVAIASLEVKVKVTTSLTIDSVPVGLSETISTPLSVGSVLSNVTELALVTEVTLVPAFPARSL